MAIKQAPFMTVGDVASHFGIPAWKVRRLYENSILPPPARAGLYRLIPAGDLPRIEAALRKAGYLVSPGSHAAGTPPPQSP